MIGLYERMVALNVPVTTHTLAPALSACGKVDPSTDGDGRRRSCVQRRRRRRQRRRRQRQRSERRRRPGGERRMGAECEEEAWAHRREME